MLILLSVKTNLARHKHETDRTQNRVQVCSRRQLLNYIYLLVIALPAIKTYSKLPTAKKGHNLKPWLSFRDHLPET